MALVQRGGGIYMYRSFRRDGRVSSQYLGSGKDARALAMLDAERRAVEDAERRAARAERDRLAAVERAVVELDEAVDSIMRAALSAAGYRQHHRGQWRKTRVQA
jgi:hypothetical protein